MKFIRKGGRVIPVSDKKDGNTDKRHVSQKALASIGSQTLVTKQGVANKLGKYRKGKKK